MVVKENELMIIPWNVSFKERFIVEDNINLLFNKISLYGCVGSLGQYIDKKLNFDVKVINGKKVICPLDDYDTYFLHGERLVRTTTVEIKASDYIDKVELNGDFTFTLKGDNDKWSLRQVKE